MSQSSHQIAVKAVDQTAGAFGSIKNRAKATGASIRSMMGGALAAAGAYFTFRGVMDGINELGKLSDLAQKTSMNVGELTQTTAALGALGIQNMGVDQFAKSLDYMQKTTGRTGMSGFLQTIEDIGKIEDTAKRGQEAMRVFGRSGMEFMPLINAANEGTAALRGVIAAMPGIPQAAADAGDDASDAMGFAANQVKSIWLQGLGFIVKSAGSEFAGGIREASLTAGNYLELYIKKATAVCITWFGKMKQSFIGVGETIGAYLGAFSENAKWTDWVAMLTPGGAIAKTVVGKITGKGNAFTDAWDAASQAGKDALREYDDVAAELDKKEEERKARFQKDFEDRALAIKHFFENYGKGAKSTGDRNGAGVDLSGSASARMPQIRNDLILGGSNASNKLAAFGPSLQIEQKKTNQLLAQVVENTSKTAENTKENPGDETRVYDG